MKAEPAVAPLGTDLMIPQHGSPTRTADWLGSDFVNGFFDSADDLDLPSTLSGPFLPSPPVTLGVSVEILRSAMTRHVHLYSDAVHCRGR